MPTNPTPEPCRDEAVKLEAEQIARHFMDADGEQIVRDMAGHLGEQLFETLKRNGMMMRSVAGAVGVLTLAAAQALAQAHDFLGRSMADTSDGGAAIDIGETEAAAIALLFLGELPEPLRAAITQDDDVERVDPPLLLKWYNAQAAVVYAAWCAVDDSSDDYDPATHVAVPNDSFEALGKALEELEDLVPDDCQYVGTGALNDDVRAALSTRPTTHTACFEQAARIAREHYATPGWPEMYQEAGRGIAKAILDAAPTGTVGGEEVAIAADLLAAAKLIRDHVPDARSGFYAVAVDVDNSERAVVAGPTHAELLERAAAVLTKPVAHEHSFIPWGGEMRCTCGAIWPGYDKPAALPKEGEEAELAECRTACEEERRMAEAGECTNTWGCKDRSHRGACGISSPTVARRAAISSLPVSGEVERKVIVAWLRAQSDEGADKGLASEKGTTRRAAFGGGSLALWRAADAIEKGEHASEALAPGDGK